MSHNELFNNLLHHIMGYITFEKTSYKINLPNGLEHDRLITLFVNELMTKYRISRKLDYLRYYFPEERKIYYPHDIIEIMRELNKINKYTIDNFIALLEKKLEEIKKIAMGNYKIFCPINISTLDNIKTLKIKDTQIEFFKHDNINDKINTIVNDIRFLGEKFTPSRYIYLCISIRARNKFYAIEKARENALIMLSLITFLQNKNKQIYSISGTPKPVYDLRLNYLFVFRDSVLLNILAYDERSDKKENYALDDALLDKLNHYITSISELEGKASNLLIKSLQAYYDGLIENRLPFSFLSLWKALEIALLKNKRMPQYKIITRLKSLLPKITPLERYFIDRLYSLRNSYIHHADEAFINQYERNLLKSYVEYAIDVLFVLIEKYNIDDINFLYSYFGENVLALERKKRLIDDIIKMRR